MISIGCWTDASIPSFATRARHATPVRADGWRPTRLMAVLVGGAVVCGALAATAAFDAASAQKCRRDIWDRIAGRPPAICELSPSDVNKRLQKAQAVERAAAERAGRRVAEGIGSRPRPIRVKPIRQSDTAVGVVRGKRSAADRNAARRDADAGRRQGVVPRSASIKPLRRAFRHVRAERRDFQRAAVRFAHRPRAGTFRGLRREFGQFRSARTGFPRAAVRFARRR